MNHREHHYISTCLPPRTNERFEPYTTPRSRYVLAPQLTFSNIGRTFPEDTTVRLMRPMSSGNSLGTSLPIRSVSSPVNSTPVGPAPITCESGSRAFQGVGGE